MGKPTLRSRGGGCGETIFLSNIPLTRQDTYNASKTKYWVEEKESASMEQKKRLESSDTTTVAMSAREDEHGHVIMGSDVQFDLSDLCASQPSSSGAGGPLK